MALLVSVDVEKETAVVARAGEAGRSGHSATLPESLVFRLHRSRTSTATLLSPPAQDRVEYDSHLATATSMSRKPAFLFVPAAWHLPAYFGPLITYLSDYGYISVAVTVPSIDSAPAVTSLQPDVNTLAVALTTLLGNDSDVIVVMHSYGGTVGIDAVSKAFKELADTERIYGKESAKIKRLVYVTARVPLEGDTIFNMLDGVLVEGPPPPRDHWTFEVRV